MLLLERREVAVNLDMLSPDLDVPMLAEAAADVGVPVAAVGKWEELDRTANAAAVLDWLARDQAEDPRRTRY